MDYNPNLNNADRQRIASSSNNFSNTRRPIDPYQIHNQTCSNEIIFRDNENHNEISNSSSKRNNSNLNKPFTSSASRNSNIPNILSEKKITKDNIFQNSLNSFNPNYTPFTSKNIQISNKENIIPEFNLEIEGSSENIRDCCEVCSEFLIEGEIIYCCLCCRFYHPNCLIYLLNGSNNTTNVSKQCEDCQSTYIFGNYELPKNPTLDYTEDTNKLHEGSTNANLSLIDTNINSLDNYKEMCGIAFYANNPESLAEIIHKKNEVVTIQQNEEIERIALSPITITTTPYSGKTKKQISSNGKVEDYIRLQNTHTTPNNKHLNMSGVSRVNEVLYEQSPEESLHGIRQHLSFYSPHHTNTDFYPNNININTNQNTMTENNHLNYFNQINSNIQNDKNNLLGNSNKIFTNKENTPINVITYNTKSLMTKMEEKDKFNTHNTCNEIGISTKIFSTSNLKSNSNINPNKYHQGSKNHNLDIDAFFKSINFVTGNKLNFSDKKNSNLLNTTSNSAINNHQTTMTSSINQVSFKKLNFDDIEVDDSLQDKEKEHEYSSDKENSPPLPRESSKFSYFDPEINMRNIPLEINLEAGNSHIVSNKGKIVEIPITIDFKYKENPSISTLNNIGCNLNSLSENSYTSFTKDYIILFNTVSLNIENLYHIFKIIHDKISDGDRVFTNIFKSEKWLVKEDLKQILGVGELNQKISFENYLQDTSLLNFSEIVKLINYCVDLSFEYHSNIFSIILINDIDEIPLQIEYFEEIRTVSEKLKTTKVNIIKNFTINCILLDNGKIENMGNIKYVSFLNDLSMLCMGYFYAPKGFSELNKSIHTLMSIFDQSCLLNLKANIKGNKDPSVFIEVLNYPHVKKQHNDYDIYLGSLLRKEKKYLNLTAVVILNNQNISLNLPLVEVKLEFLSTKNFKERETVGISAINSFYNILNLSGANNLVKNKTPYFKISIPVITLEKEIQISHSVYMRNCCARIGEKLKQSLESMKRFEYEESLGKLYECKQIFSQTLENQTGLMKLFKNYSDANSLNNTSNINHNGSNLPLNSQIHQNSFFINPISNYQCDDSFNDFIKNSNSMNITKIFNFCFLILQDINYLIDIVKNRQINIICDFFTTNQSLIFYRPVNLSDDRFLEDMI